MRKLKALVRQWSIAQQHYYQPLVDKLQQCSIHTVHDLFQANLDSLVSLTNSRRQIIRAFREQVILDSMAKEASFQPKDVVTFSTGFATLDRSLGGGIRLGEVTEICGTAQSGRAKYVQQIMENFLLAFEQSSMHHIDTTGLFDAKSIQTQLLPRIHCNKAFSIPAVITVLESVGAFQAVDGLPTMIVLDNMASVLDSNWQAGFHEFENMVQVLQDLRKLRVAILVSHSATMKDNRICFGYSSEERYIREWDPSVDLRLFFTHNECLITKSRRLITPRTIDLIT